MGQEHTTKSVSYRKIENLYYQKKNQINRRKKLISVVFKWGGGGENVSIVGSWNNWREEITVPFNEEEKSNVIILTIPEGKHYFRFLVDGEYKVNKVMKQIQDKDGDYSNEITVSESTSNIEEKESDEEKEEHDHELELKQFNEFKERWKMLPNKPPPMIFDEKYGQKEQIFVESRKTPPQMPIHLKYTPLKSKFITNQYFETTILPIPLHVTLDHLYFSRDQHLSVIGITRSSGEYDDRKYTTIQYYFDLAQLQDDKDQTNNVKPPNVSVNNEENNEDNENDEDSFSDEIIEEEFVDSETFGDDLIGVEEEVAFKGNSLV